MLKMHENIISSFLISLCCGKNSLTLEFGTLKGLKISEKDYLFLDQSAHSSIWAHMYEKFLNSIGCNGSVDGSNM